MIITLIKNMSGADLINELNQKYGSVLFGTDD